MEAASKWEPHNKNKHRREEYSGQAPEGVMVIFSRTEARSNLGYHPPFRWEIYAKLPAATSRLPWLENSITFDRSDQPKHLVDIGRFPLVVSTVIETVRATKVFMHGGTDFNLLYWDTFKRLKIGIDKLCPVKGLITGVVLG